MAIKNPASRQALSGPALKKFRSDVAKLKKVELVGKKVDARSQRPTRYMREQVKKYSDVLAGKAKVIHTPKRADAKEFAGSMRVKGKSVVVPIVNKSERVRYNSRTGEISSFARENGRTMRKVVKNKNIDLYDIKTYPRGPNIRYRIPSPHGYLFQTDNVEEFFAEMFKYETKAHNPYKNIYAYAQIIYLEPDSDEDDTEE